jgi:hypothetical protein
LSRTGSGKIIAKALLKKSMTRVHSTTEGIESDEIQRRKLAGECLRCAWPSDTKGSHGVKNCRRSIKLDKGAKGYPKVITVIGEPISSDLEEE